MREILFRGKDKNDGTWFEGFFVKQGDDAYLFTEGQVNRGIGTNGWLNCCQMYSVIPETICQYTGLKDKNGKRIFEGDIIKTHYSNTPKADFIEQVVFHNGRFCGMYEHDITKIWATLADGIKHLSQDKSVYMEWCEVIGNIHDNPELLEG